MMHTRQFTKGVSMIRAIRGELPPADGTGWRLDVNHAHAELALHHPIFGVRRHLIEVTGGALSGMPGHQFELMLAFACTDPDSEMGDVLTARFRSASITRPDIFRYIAKGDVRVGTRSGIVVLRIHDLNWNTARPRGEESRILTMSASVDRPLWDFDQPELRTPRFTRATAEVFIHTEWTPDPVRPAA